jgi:hypothetical protein
MSKKKYGFRIWAVIGLLAISLPLRAGMLREMAEHIKKSAPAGENK